MQQEISKTMNAAVLHKHCGDIKVERISTPIPKDDEVLVKIHASGVCHTDVHAVDGDWPIKSKLPLICGHEGAGEIVQIGKNVRNYELGQRVGIPWLHSACGYCEYCITGRETLCPKILNTGYSTDGCFSEYVIGHGDYLANIPDSLEYTQAAPILCAGVTTYKALKVSKTKTDEWICIIGAGGGLGHLAIQYAKAMGFNVIALDRGNSKLDFCRSLGADVALDSHDDHVRESIHDASKGGCHSCLILATQLDVFSKAISYTRSDGNIVFVGLPSGDINLNVFETVLRGISIHGSIVGTRQDMNEALSIAASGKIKCNVENAEIDDIQNVLDRVRHGQVNGRIVINF